MSQDTEPSEAPAQQAGPRVIKLDTEDTLRLENMILTKQVADMSASLANSQAKEKQAAFQNHIVAKFNIDISKFQLQVNPTNSEIIVAPR